MTLSNIPPSLALFVLLPGAFGCRLRGPAAVATSTTLLARASAAEARASRPRGAAEGDLSAAHARSSAADAPHRALAILSHVQCCIDHAAHARGPGSAGNKEYRLLALRLFVRSPSRATSATSSRLRGPCATGIAARHPLRTDTRLVTPPNGATEGRTPSRLTSVRELHRIPRRRARLLRRPRDGQHQVLLGGQQAVWKDVRRGADEGARRRARAGVRPGQGVPALPRRPLRQGQDALQDPPGRLRRRRRRRPGGTSRSPRAAPASAAASTTPTARGWRRSARRWPTRSPARRSSGC